MSLFQRILWTTLTLSAAFVVVSLSSRPLQPHRFFFGAPLVVALLLLLGSASLLSGGLLTASVASAVSPTFARRAWYTFSILMFLRSCLSGFGGRNPSAAAENTISLLFCLGAATFLLIDLYQQSESWPKFDPPGFGMPSRSYGVIKPSARPSFSVFGLVSCGLAAVGVWRLWGGLQVCARSLSWSEPFFISELGIGPSADQFTHTFLEFGVLMLPFFLNFVMCFRNSLIPEAIRFALGGCMAVGGIMGIGIWDLRNPLHYLSIAVWLWPMFTILDSEVPTARGFVPLQFPTWLVKLCMAAYIVTMLTLPFSDSPFACIWCQRFVVVLTLLWLAWLWKVVLVEAAGLGEILNADVV